MQRMTLGGADIRIDPANTRTLYHQMQPDAADGWVRNFRQACAGLPPETRALFEALGIVPELAWHLNYLGERDGKLTYVGCMFFCGEFTDAAVQDSAAFYAGAVQVSVSADITGAPKGLGHPLLGLYFSIELPWVLDEPRPQNTLSPREAAHLQKLRRRAIAGALALCVLGFIGGALLDGSSALISMGIGALSLAGAAVLLFMRA